MQIVLPVNALKAAYSDVTVVIWALSVVEAKEVRLSRCEKPATCGW